MLLKIACIDIWSEDYKKLAKWYENTLEIKPIQTLNLPDDTGIVFDIGGVLLYIGRHSEIVGKSKDPKRIMVEFEVENLNAVYSKLISQNVEFIRKPELASTKDMYVATILDLDGNIIQLVEPKKS